MSEMQFGLILRADPKSAVEGLRLTRAEADALTGATRESTAAFKAGQSAGRDYASMAQQLRAALDPMYAVQHRYNEELERADALHKAGAISSREYAAAQKLANDNLRAAPDAIFKNGDAVERHNRQLGLQRAGYQQLGFQMQDVFASYASGSKLTVIAAQQSGQLTSALAMIAQGAEGSKGAMGAFSTFMGGPWGIAIGVAVSVLGALAVAFTDADDASGKAGGTQRTFTDILKDSKASWEEVTQAAADYADQAEKSRQVTILSLKAEAEGIATRLRAAAAIREQLKAQLEQYQAQVRMGPTGPNGQGQFAASVAEGTLAEQIGKMNEAIDKLNDAADSVQTKVAVEVAKLNNDPAYRTKTGFDVLAQNLTGSVGERIARATMLGAQQQSVLDAMRPSASRGTGTMADFPLPFPARSITSGFGPRVAPTRGASTNHPGLDFGQPVGTPVRVPQVGTVEAVGFDRGLGKFVVIDHGGGTKTSYGHLSDNSMVARGQSVQAGDIIGKVGSTGISTGAHLDYRVTVNGKAVDPRKGSFPIDPVKVAENGQRSREAMEREAKKLAEDTDKFLGEAWNGADAVYWKYMATGDVFERMNGVISEDMASAMADLTRASDDQYKAWRRTQDETAAVLDNIVGMTRALDRLGGAGSMLGDLGALVVGMTSGDFGGVGGKLGALFDLSPELRGLGVEIGQQLDRVFGGNGAFAKTMAGLLQAAGLGVSGATLVLGQKGNNVGSAVGGVLGESLGKSVGPVIAKAVGGTLGKALGSAAGPLGAIAGGILGGLVGSIFSKKIKGSSSVSQDGVSTSANDSQVTSNLNSMGGQLQSAIAQIASKLGGQVGTYDVGFGQYKDYFQVSGSGSDRFLGQTYYNQKSGQALYDGKDAGAALSAAIKNAISDGAIKGVSAAVAKALKSSSDIDKALTEALKVQDTEMALGGLGAQLQKAFRDFEAQASERARIAKQYGFDIVAMEKRNGEDRLKLTKQLLSEQTGSLQKLIDSMIGGSLFEGSAVDQRQALLDQIAKAKADVDAGVSGAADTLSSLYEQLNSVSKEAFGTTGGFAADRAAILSGANDAIAKANERIAAAQTVVSDPALSATNAALDENNDQNAQMLSYLAQNGLLLEKNNALLAALNGQVNSASLSSLAAKAWTGY